MFRVKVLCLILCVGVDFSVTFILNYLEMNIEKRLVEKVDNIMCYVYWREMYLDIDIELSEVKC